MSEPFTPAEQAAWDALGEAAALILKLPAEHPMEEWELAQDLHHVQRALMARPTRRALGLVKVGGEEAPEGPGH